MSRGFGSRGEGPNRLPAVRTPEERNALIAPYFPLALALARRFRGARRVSARYDAEDLRQEALAGLMRAGDLWVDGKGEGFPNYARRWVRKFLLDATRESASAAVRAADRAVPILVRDRGARGGADDVCQDDIPDRPHWQPPDPEDLEEARRLLGDDCYRVLLARAGGSSWREAGALAGMGEWAATRAARRAAGRLGVDVGGVPWL